MHTVETDVITTWWDRIDEGLDALPANAEIRHDALRSNDFFDTYWVRMTSLENYVIAAWLNIPKGDGAFPSVMYTSTHMSVVTPAPYEFRTRAVTLNVISRGQRGADKPYAAAFPGHLTVGIDDPERFIHRGVVADCIRAWEFLRSLPQVDPDRTAMIGTDLALLVDARRPGAKAIHVTGSFWYRMLEIAASTDAYPFEEINDHLRAWPDQRDAVARTLSFLDPLYQAESIGAKVLFHRDRANPLLDAAWLTPLVSRMRTEPSFLDMTHKGQTDYDAMDAWISAELGMKPYPRSWTPEDIGPWSV
jgi:cephalosporin-C deacetylase-like acetyl esterase